MDFNNLLVFASNSRSFYLLPFTPSSGLHLACKRLRTMSCYVSRARLVIGETESFIEIESPMIYVWLAEADINAVE
eukprot:6189074-Pleurochrysis_carterae.AAC.1